MASGLSDRVDLIIVRRLKLRPRLLDHVEVVRTCHTLVTCDHHIDAPFHYFKRILGTVVEEQVRRLRKMQEHIRNLLLERSKIRQCLLELALGLLHLH